MPPAARVGDLHVCPLVTGIVPHVGGPILPPGCLNVLVGVMPAARVGDMCTCVGPPDVVMKGSPTVLIGNSMAARMGDSTAHGGAIVIGCPTVMIGEVGTGRASPGGAGLVFPPKCAYLKKGHLVSGNEAEFDSTRKESKVTKPGKAIKHSFPGDSKPQDAVEYDVEVDGKVIKAIVPVAGPTEPGAKLPSVDEVAKGLGTVPSGQLATIKQVEVSPNRNPSDEYWATQYKTPGFRSAATGGSGGVTMYPTPNKLSQSRIDSNLIHEGGHTFQSEIWKDAKTKKAWEDAIKSDPYSPSKYSDNSPGEDMSESLVMYSLSKGTPCEEFAKKMFPGRYAELDKLMKK